MAPLKQFRVFGELVEVLVSTEQTGGTFCVVTQTCSPGGGPPPHIHEYEERRVAGGEIVEHGEMSSGAGIADQQHR